MTLRSCLFYAVFLLHFLALAHGHSHCNKTLGALACNSSLAYFTQSGQTLFSVAELFNTTPETVAQFNQISEDSILQTNQLILIPTQCSCQENGALDAVIPYVIRQNDTGYNIATNVFQQLTNFSWFEEFTPGLDIDRIYPGNITNVPFNCSCPQENATQKLEFVTYSVRPLDTLSLISNRFNTTVSAILQYNTIPDPNFILIGTIYFVPINVRETPVSNPSSSKRKIAAASIAGIIIGSTVFIIIVLIASILLYVYLNREELALERRNDSLGRIYIRFFKSPASSEGNSHSMLITSESANAKLTRDSFPSSLEYTFDEICKSTKNFNESCKIGSGGFSVVYFGKLRGKDCAIKIMNFSASKDFYTELNVLLKVQGHPNLVKILGFCVEKALALIFEFVNNGTLDDHLRQKNKPSLSWENRVSIAIDIAKGLEYLHESLSPSVIHRDIKASNILIDSNFSAKVADFGLTKFIRSVNAQLPPSTRLVGTFGYMSPEYAQYGDASAQSDVYAFGVILYELISAKNAILDVGKNWNTSSNPRGLPSLFEVAMQSETSMQTLLKPLIDPSLTASMDQIRKMAIIAMACTRFRAEQRPNMRTVVGALSTLAPQSANTADQDAIFECLLEN